MFWFDWKNGHSWRFSRFRTCNWMLVVTWLRKRHFLGPNRAVWLIVRGNWSSNLLCRTIQRKGCSSVCTEKWPKLIYQLPLEPPLVDQCQPCIFSVIGKLTNDSPECHLDPLKGFRLTSAWWTKSTNCRPWHYTALPSIHVMKKWTLTERKLALQLFIYATFAFGN